MNPSDFDHSNKKYVKPEGWTDEQCSGLDVFQGVNDDGHPLIISCWKPTPEEIADIVAGKPVWLGILTAVQPPVYLTTSNPFKDPDEARDDA